MFEKNGIDGEKLLSLTENKMKELLNIDKFSIKRKLTLAINKLKKLNPFTSDNEDDNEPLKEKSSSESDKKENITHTKEKPIQDKENEDKATSAKSSSSSKSEDVPKKSKEKKKKGILKHPQKQKVKLKTKILKLNLKPRKNLLRIRRVILTVVFL